VTWCRKGSQQEATLFFKNAIFLVPICGLVASLVKGGGREHDPLFQGQSNVGPALLQCWVPEVESKPLLIGQIQKQLTALREETSAFLRYCCSEKGCQNFVS